MPSAPCPEGRMGAFVGHWNTYSNTRAKRLSGVKMCGFGRFSGKKS